MDGRSGQSSQARDEPKRPPQYSVSFPPDYVEDVRRFCQWAPPSLGLKTVADVMREGVRLVYDKYGYNPATGKGQVLDDSWRDPTARQG